MIFSQVKPTKGLQWDADAADLAGAVDEAGPQCHAAAGVQLRQLGLGGALAAEVALEHKFCAGQQEKA